MDELPRRASTFDLAGETISKAAEFVGAEMTLAKLELSEKFRMALLAIASMLLASVFLIVALVVLLMGAAAVLVQYFGWSPYAADFTIGAAVACVAVLTIVVAARQLSSSRLTPQRTLNQLQSATSQASEKLS